MSIFTINYLYDISQNDQSLIDLKEKDLKKLKQKSKLNKEKYRQFRYQSLAQVDQQIKQNILSMEENKIIQQALKNQQSLIENGQNSGLLQVNNRPLNNKKEEIQKKQNQIKNFKQQNQNCQTMRQKVYQQVIKRRHEKLKKTQKRDYFNVHLDV